MNLRLIQLFSLLNLILMIQMFNPKEAPDKSATEAKDVPHEKEIQQQDPSCKEISDLADAGSIETCASLSTKVSYKIATETPAKKSFVPISSSGYNYSQGF